VARPVLGLLLGLVLVLAACTHGSAPPAGPPAAPPVANAADYVGAELCRACHSERYEKYLATKMGRLFLKEPRDAREQRACETCHGPGRAHVAAGGGRGKGGLLTFGSKDPVPVEQRNLVCLQCHARGARLFWSGSTHESRGVPCTGCHRIMERVSDRHQLARADEIETCGPCHVEKRARQMRSSHMPLREGRLTCSTCHEPHGTLNQALLKRASTNDTCYACHAEKRGPFLWEHAPVTESCTTCHDAHGSNHEKLLKVAKPRLCQQCHTEAGHPSTPNFRDAQALKRTLGRGCVNCHTNIHGSNHPSGYLFTR
jgi:DmsE family decaheme c-type cytochrome